MTMQRINWSERDQKYWINDADGDVLWFDSSLDAKAALREIELKRAALDERRAIIRWLRAKDQLEDCYSELKDQWLSDRIARGEHHNEK